MNNINIEEFEKIKKELEEIKIKNKELEVKIIKNNRETTRKI